MTAFAVEDWGASGVNQGIGTTSSGGTDSRIN
jgi:hypothetical protein